MKRLTLFCGHYGSGKTNIAVNYALHLKAQGFDTVIADADIVNPYFRTKDSEDELRAAGVDVISLPFANTNVDLPSLPSELYSVVQNRSRHAVLDIGGDDRGATALGRFAPYILEEGDFESLLVVNFYRPLTRTAAEALEVLHEISAATTVPVTGIVNNSNLGAETTADDVRATLDEAKALSVACGLPVVFTSVEERLAEELSDVPDLFPMKLQHRM